MNLVALLAAFLWIPVLAQGGQSPVRDQARASFTGTARITGTVVLDTDKRPPLRRATVTLSRQGIEDIRTTSTDDAGRYSFSNLPAASYTLGATKGGHIAMSYGAPKPAMPGRPIVLSDGQTFAATPIALIRGAVIAGRLFDRAGRPVSGVEVLAAQFVTIGSERKRRQGNGTAVGVRTNAHGEYRLFGLMPGTYLVSVDAFPAGGELVETSAAEMAWARRPEGSGPPAARPNANAPTFFPSVTPLAAAEPVVVGPGEERLGVDFAVQVVPVAKIEGTVTGIDGRPVTGAMVERSPKLPNAFFSSESVVTRGQQDGSFSFEGVQPGEYIVFVRGTVAPSRDSVGLNPPAPSPSQVPATWGLTEVSINGADRTGVAITMQPGMVISGRVAGEGPPAGLDVTRTRVQVTPLRFGPTTRNAAGAVGADGEFRVEGLSPGQYRLIVQVPAPYVAHSAILNGRDLLDEVLTIVPNGSLSGIVVTVRPSLPEISGSLTDSAGQRATDVYVVVFAQDRQYWQPSSRRVASVRPTEDGKYLITGLPAGDYLLAAVTELDLTIRNEPSFLEELAKAAIKLTLTDGEKKVQDLRVGGR